MLYYLHWIQLIFDSDMHLSVRAFLIKVSSEKLCCSVWAVLFCLIISAMHCINSMMKLSIITAKFCQSFILLIVWKMLFCTSFCISDYMHTFWMLWHFQISFCLEQLHIIIRWLLSQFLHFADMWWQCLLSLTWHVMILQMWSNFSCESVQMKHKKNQLLQTLKLQCFMSQHLEQMVSESSFQ